MHVETTNESLIQNKNYLTTVTIYGLVAMMQFASRLLFSLICKTGTELGGIGIGSERIVSLIQSAAGLFVLVFPPLLTPRIKTKIGLIPSMVLLNLLLIPLCGFVSYLGAFPLYLKYAFLAFFYGATNSIVAIFIFYISICISNAVNPKSIGIANGISQAVIGVLRAISTVSFGGIYGWSVTDGYLISGVNAHIAYFGLIILLLINLVFILFVLEKSVEKKKTNTFSETLMEDFSKVVK